MDVTTNVKEHVGLVVIILAEHFVVVHVEEVVLARQVYFDA